MTSSPRDSSFATAAGSQAAPGGLAVSTRISGRRHLLADIRKSWICYLFILPNLVGVLLFLAFPVVFALYMSFTEWDILTSPEFVGLQNYRTMFTDDPLFWTSLRNSAYYVLLTVPTTMLIALGLAMAMNQAVRGIAFFRAAIYVPVLTSAVAVAFVWQWIFNYDFGLLNAILDFFHLPSVRWLTSSRWAIISLAIMSVWKSAGYFAVILFAALQGVPEVLHEAAEIDGATAWRRFLNITLPLIAPALLFVTVISVIGSFQVFDQVYLVTGNGGPGTATYVYNLHLFNEGFKFFHMGYAAALAYVLFAILFVITYLQLRIGRDRATAAYDFE
jgi:multiple sugar transport system permease protein